MSDYRATLLQSIMESLSTILDHDTLQAVSNKIICVLDDYDVAKRSTELIVYDDTNTRILKRYAACLSVDGKAKLTIDGYIREVRAFSDFIGGKPLTEVGVYDIRFYLAKSKERGISDRTLENARSYISTFYRWMTAEEMIRSMGSSVDSSQSISFATFRYFFGQASAMYSIMTGVTQAQP